MMICPRCGAVYPVSVSFCVSDGTALVPQPVSQMAPAVQTAPPSWPVAPMAPKRKGGLLALVLAIALVVVAAVGAAVLLTRNRPDVSPAPPATPIAPVTSDTPSASVPDDNGRTYGLKQLWQQPFDYDWASYGYSYMTWLLSSQVWLIGDDTRISGLDPDTGQEMWHYDFGENGSVTCAHTLVDGKVACLVNDQSSGNNNSQQVCLYEARTGDPQCLDLDGTVSPAPGWTLGWVELTPGDGALFLRGRMWSEPDYLQGSAVLRVDLNPLKVQWSRVFTPSECSNDATPDEDTAVDSGDSTGVTGDVFWYRSEWQGDFGGYPFAVDVRNGQSIFASGICPLIVPVMNDTFIVPAGIDDGSVTLPAGGKVNFVHADGGAIAYGTPAPSNGGIADADTVRPTVPIYYTYDPGGSSDGTGTLGVVSGDSWNVTMQLQHFLAGAGGTYLNAVVSGNTIVVAGGHGQVEAIDFTTGKVQWSATVPVDDLGYGSTSDLAIFIFGDVVVVSKVSAVSSQTDMSAQTTLLSLATGEVVGGAPGDAIVSRDGTMLGVVNQTDSVSTITRYVPSGS
ncbi:MAG: PQQ-binding-like beta-propeller repeat protein [Propionibacteriaceae bacterium]|nr:PQQ-binding-like beta-propeller repeat protein [Propionibacteriaceae bacterium]